MSTNSIENTLEIRNTDVSANNVSRRRLAFRPQFAPNKLNKNIINSTESAQELKTNLDTNLNMKGLSPTSTSACDLEQKSPRRRLVTSWSFQEMLIFYEGLKQVNLFI